eukprot:291114_1
MEMTEAVRNQTASAGSSNQIINSLSDMLSVHIEDLFLDRDVYNFYLLYRKTENYQNLNFVRKFKIKFLVFLCAFVQMGSMSMLLLISDELNYDTKEASVNCDTNSIDADNCVITEDKFNYIYTNKMSLKNYMARILSLSLIMAYMYPMISSIPLYAIKYMQTKSVSWIIMCVFQAFVLFTVSWRINELVYKSTSYIDIFSVGIGFIILLEVDTVLYQSAYSAQFASVEHELFSIKLTQNELKNTIYSVFSKDTYDLLTFSVCLSGYLFSACLACGWYSLGYEHDENLLLYNILITIPSLAFLFLLVIWPFWYSFRAVCNRA